MQERYIDSAGSSLWTATQGIGIPVVLCSGGPGCCDYLGPVADMLNETAQTICYELRGCGRSEHATHYSVATSLADVEAVRQQYGVDQWIVVGHSWGADLALIYALEHTDRVLGLVCLSGGRIQNDREWSRVYREKRDAGLEPPPDYDYPPNMDVNQQVMASWKAYIQRPTLLKDIASLTLPALFVYGSEDIRPSWAVRQVAHLLPNATFTMLEGAPHDLWLTHAKELKENLQTFVGSLKAGI
ncbi:MAG: alpha/beta hydrolase [Chloroflexota bacterium]